MKKLLAPLSEVRCRAHVAIWGGTSLLTVYLYQGNHVFFTRRLSSLGTRDPFAEWYAHGYQFLAAFILLLVVPCLWIRLGARESFADHGLCLGDWRFGLRFLGLGVLALALPLYVNAGSPAFQAEYPLAGVAGRSLRLFLLWELCYLVYYVAWEFFFRGFWQIGLSRDLGLVGALALQTAVSTVMHIGKPEAETLSAIAAGVVFGLVASRTRSVLYVILLHWYVGLTTDLFCILRGG